MPGMASRSPSAANHQRGSRHLGFTSLTWISGPPDSPPDERYFAVTWYLLHDDVNEVGWIPKEGDR